MLGATGLLKDVVLGRLVLVARFVYDFTRPRIPEFRTKDYAPLVHLALRHACRFELCARPSAPAVLERFGYLHHFPKDEWQRNDATNDR